MAASLRNMAQLLAFVLIICLDITGVLSQSRDVLQCAYLGSNGAYAASNLNKGDPHSDWHSPLSNSETPGTILADNVTVRCNRDAAYCYTAWQADPHNLSRPIIRYQGCWTAPKNSCQKNVCEGKPSGTKKMSNRTSFCCCTGYMCNLNATTVFFGPVPPAVTTSEIEVIVPDPNYKERTIIIALAPVCAVALVTFLSYLTYRLCLGSQKPPPEEVPDVESPPIKNYKLDNLKICSRIQKGRYGEVWKGMLEDQEVAIKIFRPNQKQYYMNEKDIYSLPHMDHQALPKFYGADERTDVDGVSQFCIVMSFIPEGTLTSYLKHNVINWSTLCKMCHSVASGLAHLHIDITQGDKIKPAVAHRDFNTRNILVKEDLSCVVCDFGFAMKIMGGRYYKNGQEEVAEQSSLTDVGTLRYMAPEVLDGAVNLRDCESSLKQIDVYALGLVLWEIASRCSDLYQGLPVPDYQVPYQTEAGLHPTFDEMQLLVSRNKTRPTFPDVWKDSNPAIRALKDTIEDSWDQDAEARLTALCVEERVLDMATLWDGRPKGVTPTANTNTVLSTLSERGVVQRNLMSQPDTSTSSRAPDRVVQANGAGQNADARLISSGEPELMPLMRPSRSSNSDYSMSASTVEVTLSPTDGTESATLPSKSNRNQVYAKNNRVLQPHQGTNPTVERNTHKRSDEELTVIGNTLVNKNLLQLKPDPQPSRSDGMSDDIFESLGDNLESSLVQHDMLTQQQRHPIPMVQNQVRPSGPSVRPKDSNLVGHSHVAMATPRAQMQDQTKHQLKSKLAKFLKTDKLNSMFSWGSTRGQPDGSDTGNENMLPPAPLMAAPQNVPQNVNLNLLVATPQPEVNQEMTVSVPLSMEITRNQTSRQSNLPDENIQVRPPNENIMAQMEVSVEGQERSIRPRTLLVSGQSERYNVDEAANRMLGAARAEIGVAHLERPRGGQPALVKVRSRSRSSNDISPSSPLLSEPTNNSVELEDRHIRLGRPNSLAIKNPRKGEKSSEVRNNNSQALPKRATNKPNKMTNQTGSGKPKHQRQGSGSDVTQPVKASNEGKESRLSLNDDRIMSPQLAEALTLNKIIPTDKLNKSSISLQQFGSAENDVDRIRPADVQC